jgi:hypothetical protein
MLKVEESVVTIAVGFANTENSEIAGDDDQIKITT